MSKRSPSLRDLLFQSTRRNLNKMLDIVDEFERQGGFSSVVDGSFGEPTNTRTGLTRSNADRKTMRQYYANLEVPFDSDRATVKQQYRNLLRRYHPDKHSGDPERERLATELTQELTRAYAAVTEYLTRQNR